MSSINLLMPNIPIKTELKAYYDYKSFKNNILYDYTANKFNVPVSTGKVTVNKNFISGNNQTALIFPSGMVTQTYTLIHLMKYNGTNRQRILQDYNGNWSSGFSGNKNGMAFHGKWITQYQKSIFPQNDWILSVDTMSTYSANKQNLTVKQGFDNIDSDGFDDSYDDDNDDNDNDDDNKYDNDIHDIESDEEFGMIENFKGFGRSFKKISRAFKPPKRKKSSIRLSINRSKKVSATENSDWAFVMLALYDGQLTTQDITKMENFILNTQYKGYVNFFNPNSLKIPPSLPIKDGLTAYYDYNSFFNSTWYDYTKKNNAVLSSGGVNVNNGYIEGNDTTRILFPKKLLNENYTLIHITKYNGKNKQRILQGIDVDWLSGFWNGFNYSGYHNEWITPNNTDLTTKQMKKMSKTMIKKLKESTNNKNHLFGINDWMLTIDSLNSLRSNQKNMTLNNFNKKKTKTPNQIAINMGKENKKTSDWAMAVVIVYNRTLTQSEILELEKWLMSVQYQGLIKQSLAALNYSCVPNIIKSKNEQIYMGKPNKTYSEFEYASYNKKALVPCSQENIRVAKPLKNILCANWESNPIASDPELCNNAFKYYNLYKTDNPLVTKGKDLNYSNKNTIEDSHTLFDLATYNTGAFSDTNTADSIKKELQNIISQTPLKLGCCLRDQKNNSATQVSVRVPLSPQIAKKNPKLKKFNFERENLTIPEGTCPANLYNGSDYCNTFYDLYCQNVSNYFQQQGFSNDDFFSYAPECACYAPTKGTKNYAVPSGVPPKCYKEGCSEDNVNAYIDPISRKGQCNLTVCSSLIDLSGVKAGGNVSVNPVVNNNCGSETNASSSASDTTGTPQGDDKKLAKSSGNSSNNTSNNSSDNNQSESDDQSSPTSSNETDANNTSSSALTSKKSSNETDANNTSSSELADGSSNMIMGIVVFVIILAVIIGAYYYMTSKSSKKEHKEHKEHKN